MWAEHGVIRIRLEMSNGVRTESLVWGAPAAKGGGVDLSRVFGDRRSR